MGFRWKLISAFAAIFLIGGFCGSALTLAIARIKIPGGPQVNPHRWEDVIMHNLTTRLSLTQDQQRAIRPQVTAAVQQMHLVRRQLILQTDDLLDETFQRLETQLTPEQQRRMEIFRTKRKERIQRQLEGLKQ